MLQSSLIDSFCLIDLCWSWGKGWEGEGVSECDAAGPQVSFFYETIKAGFYIKLLKNGLCFNGVWGQSLNLKSFTSGRKNPHLLD